MRKGSITAVALAVCCVAAAFSSCGGSSTSSASSAALSKVEKKDATVSMLYSDNSTYPLKNDWDILKWIKEETGVTLDLQPVPEDDWLTKVPVVLNSGDIPDIIPRNFPKGTDVLAGIYLPISDYEDQMPHYKAFIEKYGLRDELDQQKMSDGKYYMVPMKTHSKVIQDQQWLIRKDYFTKNNIKIPTTMDEVEAAGKKFKELYPDSTPITNRYLTGNLMAGICYGFGTTAGWNYGDGMLYDYKAKKWNFQPTTQKWKDMLTYTNRLINEGVLDKEFATLKSDEYEKRIFTGKTFIMYDWSGNIKRYTDTAKKDDPNFDVEVILPPKGPNGDYAEAWKPSWAQACTLPASLKDNPDHLKDVLRYIDWSFTDDAELLTTWGKEGETWEKNPDNDRHMYKGANDANPVNYYASSGLDNNCFCFRENEDFLYGMLSKDSIKVFDQINKDKITPKCNPASPLTADQNDEVSEYVGGITDWCSSSMEKFIFGQMSIDKDWDSFVKTCKDKGSDKLQAEYDKATKK